MHAIMDVLNIFEDVEKIFVKNESYRQKYDYSKHIYRGGQMIFSWWQGKGIAEVLISLYFDH